MLQIRTEQIAVFETVVKERFINKVARFLRDQLTEAWAALDDHALRAQMRLRTGHLHPCGGVIFLEYKLSDDVRELFRDPMGDLPSTSNGNGELMGIIDQAVDANPDYVFRDRDVRYTIQLHGTVPDRHSSGQPCTPDLF
jgi:hypothetical protein